MAYHVFGLVKVAYDKYEVEHRRHWLLKHEMRWKDDYEWLAQYDLEGSGLSPSQGSSLTFVWRDRRKPRNTYVRMAVA